jgi:hypothetical protein
MAVDGETLSRVSVVIGRLGLAAGAALVATGVPLIVLYRPDGGATWLRTAHSLSSVLFVGAAAGLVLTAIAAAALRVDVWVRWPLAALALAVALAASWTGGLIAWDVLVIAAVTEGGSYQGIIGPLTEDLRFVVVGDAEVTPAAYATRVAVHLVALPLVAVLVTGLLWRRWRAGDGGGSAPRRAPDDEMPPVEGDDRDEPDRS